MKRLRQLLNQLRALPTWTKVVVAVILTLLAGAIENALGNLIDTASVAGFKALYGHVVPVNLFELLCLLFAPVLIAVLLFWAIFRNQQIGRNNLDWQYARTKELEIVYEKLINLIVALVRVTDQTSLDEAMERLLLEYLRGCANIVPSRHVLRAVIIRFDAASGRLVPWANLRMPPESLKSIYWRLEPKRDRAVAAESYIDGLLRLVRFVNGPNKEPVIQHAHKGAWVQNSAKYLEHEEEREARLRYESFVVLPIGRQGESPLALLCLDSKELDTFSDVRIIEVLDRMRQFLVPAIQCYRDLQSSIAATKLTSGDIAMETSLSPSSASALGDSANVARVQNSVQQQALPVGGFRTPVRKRNRARSKSSKSSRR